MLTLDGEGHKLSSFTFGGAEDDEIYDVILLGSNKFAIVGQTESYKHNYPELDNKANGWFALVNAE